MTMFFWSLLLFSHWSILVGWTDLETNSDRFVLKTEQLEIPGYPYAFNPSIVRWQGKLLLSFRIRDPLLGSTDGVGFVWLDDHYQVQGEATCLLRGADPLLPSGFSHLPSYIQDPRLIAVNNSLYMIYSNIVEYQGKKIRRMFTGELIYHEGQFHLEQIQPLLFFEHGTEKPEQKNWAPFSYDGRLLLSSHLLPHTVVEPQGASQSCITVSQTSSQIRWPWGELRGGTQALLIGDCYLGLFHTSLPMQSEQSAGKRIVHYFMGAYCFQKEPPFTITKVSPRPILGKGFYTGPEHKTWKPLRVVFPGGMVIDDDVIVVAYGKQDHEVWIVHMDKKGLLDSLIPVAER